MRGREIVWTVKQDDPPPWLPAVTQHTTPGASEKSELHMVRAVDTGVVNVSNLDAKKQRFLRS